MGLHVGRVEYQFVWNGTCSRDLGEQPLPNPVLRPPIVAIVDRRVRAVGRGRVLPAAADLQDVQDAADYPPVIDRKFARLAVRQVRLHPRPGLIREPELLLEALSLPVLWAFGVLLARPSRRVSPSSSGETLRLDAPIPASSHVDEGSHLLARVHHYHGPFELQDPEYQVEAKRGCARSQPL